MRTIPEIQRDINHAETQREKYETEANQLKTQSDDKNVLKNVCSQLKTGYEAEKKLAEQGIYWRSTEPGAI